MQSCTKDGFRARLARLGTLTAAMVLVVVGLSSGIAASAASQPEGPGAAKAVSNDLVKIKPAKVAGEYTDPETGETGRLVAKFVPTEFVEDGGALAVEGTLSGVFAGKLAKGQQRHFSEPVTLPVGGADAGGVSTPSGISPAALAPAQPACDILSLELGPLHLDLLGLVVDLEPVVLDIVAQPGAGNLLGNLLCAVAGLLDGGGGGLGDLLQGVIDALNALLDGLLDLGGLPVRFDGAAGSGASLTA